MPSNSSALSHTKLTSALVSEYDLILKSVCYFLLFPEMKQCVDIGVEGLHYLINKTCDDVNHVHAYINYQRAVVIWYKLEVL